jgi:GNAT superfamily N-acetyltransferase
MEYIKAKTEDAELVFTIVQETVKTVYPKYYPKEVVDFFCQHHNLENIQKDIENQRVGLLVDNQIIVGTGCYEENHITRVYVLPEYQRKGFGSYILQCLENEISKSYDTVCLDASLPACQLYEKRGYVTIEHCRCTVDNNAVLVYEIMEKKL